MSIKIDWNEIDEQSPYTCSRPIYQEIENDILHDCWNENEVKEMIKILIKEKVTEIIVWDYHKRLEEALTRWAVIKENRKLATKVEALEYKFGALSEKEVTECIERIYEGEQ